MNKVFKLTIALLLAASLQSTAQNIMNDTLVWESNQVKDKSSGSQFELSSQFKTYGSKKIEWLQKANTVKKVFEVSSIEGSWTEINSNGEVSFLILTENLKGRITFKRSMGNPTVEFSFIRNGAETMPFEFSINSVHPN